MLWSILTIQTISKSLYIQRHSLGGDSMSFAYDDEDSQDNSVLDKKEMSLLSYFSRREPSSASISEPESNVTHEQVMRYKSSYGMMF